MSIGPADLFPYVFLVTLAFDLPVVDCLFFNVINKLWQRCFSLTIAPTARP